MPSDPTPAPSSARLPASAAVRAFAERALESYGPELHAFLRSRLAKADVEDVFQNVFVELLKIRRPELVKNPKGYVFKIAARAVCRHRELVARNLIDFHPPETVEETADGFALARLGEHSDEPIFEQRLAAAFAALPPTHRAVFVAVRGDGLSHADAAERLNLSVHTVRKYLSEALASIRMMLS